MCDRIKFTHMHRRSDKQKTVYNHNRVLTLFGHVFKLTHIRVANNGKVNTDIHHRQLTEGANA
jgi:hypothetical protein